MPGPNNYECKRRKVWCLMIDLSIRKSAHIVYLVVAQQIRPTQYRRTDKFYAVSFHLSLRPSIFMDQVDEYPTST